MISERIKDYRQINTSDGKQVAEILIGCYLNRYPGANNRFIKSLCEESPKIQHNFIVLAIRWFLLMSEWKEWNYDDRNEGSVMLAKQIKQELLDHPISPKRMKSNKDDMLMQVCFWDDLSVADMFSRYLRSAGSGENSFSDFLNKAAAEHRTLQQSFTRLICAWCTSWAERNPGKRTDMAKMVYKISQIQAALPYI